MAIGKMIGLGGNPIYDALASRRNALIGIGAGLLSGDWGNIGRSAMAGREADDAYATQQKAEALRQQEVNKTAEWLRANYPQFADLPPAEGFRLVVEAMKQQRQSANKFGLTPIYGVGPDGQPTIA